MAAGGKGRGEGNRLTVAGRGMGGKGGKGGGGGKDACFDVLRYKTLFFICINISFSLYVQVFFLFVLINVFFMYFILYFPLTGSVFFSFANLVKTGNSRACFLVDEGASCTWTFSLSSFFFHLPLSAFSPR